MPLKERGKYQGFVAAACSIGNAIGPFVGGGLSSIGQWRWLFRTISITSVVVAVAIWFIVPLKPVSGSMRAKLAKIDFLGVGLSSAMALFLLVPISGGGSTFAWSSPIVIGLLVAGVVAGILFVLSQWKLAAYPVLPRKPPAAVTLNDSAHIHGENSGSGHDPVFPPGNHLLRSETLRLNKH